MEKKICDTYVEILRQELVPALGCTEPIAIAYACAKAREVLGCFPEAMEVWCSGNIIKNVKGVTVPRSGGMRGVEAAALLGVVGGDAGNKLEVLAPVTQAHREQVQALLEQRFCVCRLQEGVENLYIRARLSAGGHWAEVTVTGRHTHIASILRDGESLLQDDSPCAAKKGPDKSLLSVEKILEFADTTPLDQVAPILERQIQMNSAIADEGLRHAYGAQVGRTILEVYGNGVKARAKARAAAGSDARMGGCPLPVVINSGSGNQGMTVSLPVIEFARELQASHEKLLRALIVSNLVAVHQKKYIGSLSAYCGAVSAACGSGAAITYLYGGGYQEVAATITNTIANVGGIVCDGAKASCAAKIASAVDAAILGHFLGCRHCTFRPGEGLVQENVEETIENVGYIGRVGMKETDTEILRLMIDREDKLDEIHQMA